MSAAQPRRTDPEYISAMEHFESIPHEEIYAKTQQIDPGDILQASLVWLDAAATITASLPITGNTSDSVMDSAGWEGVAADAARASTRSFAASMDELAEVIAEVGGRLGAVAAAAEAVKLAVAPPGEPGPIGDVARLLEGARVIDAQQAQEAVRQEAVLAMNMIYKPAYSLAGNGVPALPEPPQPPGATSPSAAHPNSPAPQSHSPQQQPNQQPPPTTPNEPAPPQTTTPPAPPTPSQQTPTTPAPPPSPAPIPPPESSSPPTPPPPGQRGDPHLNDPGGQPGITGPIPQTSTSPPPGQSGVTPNH